MWLTPNSASESMQHRSPQPARVSCRLAAGAHAEPVHRRGDFAEHLMTGGMGHAELRQFYAMHFIPKMPPDIEMTPLTRTIGTDQLVDEMVVRFTHTVEMNWMLPGIAPTGKRVEVALVSSFISATASSLTSISTGTKPRCWLSSG